MTIKRIFDFSFSLIGLVIFCIPLIIIAVLLIIFNKGAGPFFLQTRVGKNAQLFKIIKFKTMTDQRDKNGNLLPDNLRMTKIGKFVRSTSLDELPQLINVLIGDMSFVGPRPLLEKYIPLYSKEQFRRHEVKPGITGWAQVNGRNAISWKRKFELDVWYVDNMTFELDLKIVLMTLQKVMQRKDISSATSATMEAFNGNN